jgi:SNF2 family DNA or RNA helicase
VKKIWEKNEFKMKVKKFHTSKMSLNKTEFIKRHWDGDNRWRRTELNEIATNLNMTLDYTNSNEKLYNRIKLHLNKVTTQLKDFQIESVQKMLQLETDYDGGFLLSDAGVGKCHGFNADILMFDGTIKKVQDIQVGEFLMGDDSTPRKVLSLARGRDIMYDIIPVKGEKYTVNQEHILCLKISNKPSLNKDKRCNSYCVRWFENNKYNNKNFKQEIQAKEFLKTINNQKIIEIAVKDYINLAKGVKHDLKGYKVPVEFEEKQLNIDPYMIGFWLGDGTSKQSEITTQDSTIVKYFKTNLGQYKCYLQYKDNKTNKYTYRINGDGSGNYNCNQFLSELKEQNLINNKHIPMDYKCNSRENRLKLLAGLIDSDGNLCHDKCTFDFIQKSEKLIDDVIYLVRSLGFSCYKSKQKKGCWYLGEYKEDDYYRICISGNTNEIPVLCPRKKANQRKQKKDILKTGIKIEEIGYNNYYGFVIDSNNRYMMGDFTVTHNTLTSIDLIIKTRKRTLVICPSGLIDNWVNEFHKHSNVTEITKYHGTDRKKYINMNDLVYITSYSIIGREYDINFEENSLFSKLKFDRIILDEAHYIRNCNTQYSRAVLALSEIQNVDCKKFVVTATPIFNTYKDCYAYFKFLQLEGIDTRQDFTQRIVKDVHGLKILNEYIKKYSVKYLKEDVLLDLKAKEHINVTIPFTETEQQFYNSLYDYSCNRMKRLVTKIKRKSTETDLKRLLHSHVMVFILRLKQACNSPWLILNHMKRLVGSGNLNEATQRLKFFNDSKNLESECPICYDNMADRINNPCGHKLCSECLIKLQNSDILNCHMCREFVKETHSINSTIVPFENQPNEIPIAELVSSKINALIELVGEKLAKNEKVVICSQWVQYLDIIRECDYFKDIRSISLQGNVPLYERTDLIKRFQTNPDIKICFVSLNSSAEGITLTAANNLILMDSWWNYSLMDQIFNRIHRISQEKDVKIYQLAIQDTIEQKIKKLVNQKKGVSELCLNDWFINDLENYDSKWMTDTIKLIERPEEVQ